MADNPSSFAKQPTASSASDESSDGNIRVGDVTGSTGVAIGSGATSTVTYITGDQQYDVHSLANPYLGLQSFTYADHAKYAGREKLIAETVARLTAPDDPLALLFVTGASGSGKSSFVQAGVLPALEMHYNKQNLEWAVFRPSRDPLAALSDAMWRQLGLPQFDAPADFGDFLQTHTPPQQVNVIVIDQFEELFTQSNSQPRDALFNLLTQLPPFRMTRTHIIATVRADYLPELFALRELYDIAKRGIDLRVMSVDELREAIQQPLRAEYPNNNKRFQPELVERLAQDAAEDAAYLPLLQVTLEEIWRKGTLTLGEYTNLADAIKQRADKVLAYQDYDAAQSSQPRPSEEQAAILNLCLDLVDVSLDDEARRDVRRRRSKDELTSSTLDRVRLIDTLTQARLLSVSTESGEQTRVEVDLIHETLLPNWDRLRQAIAERRDELRQRVRFEQQLKEWIGQNRSKDYLLSGVRLAEARELQQRDDVSLNSTNAEDFVFLSREAEEERQQFAQRLARGAELGQLAGSLAHRIGNTGGTIRIRVAELSEYLNEMLPGDYVSLRNLESIASNNQYLLNLSDVLFKPFRALEVPMAPSNITLLLNDAIRGAQIPPDVEVQTHYAQGLPLVKINRFFVEVFLEIINNAVEVMQGALKKNLSISVGYDENWVRITFKGTGPSVPEKDLRRVFELFLPENNGGDKRHVGSGLWWVRTFLRHLGGDIELDSKVGEGLTVTLRLIRG